MQKAIMLVLAGVAIGLLLAPDKGSITQRKVSNWLSGTTDDAKNAIDDAAGNIRSKVNAIKDDLSDAKDDGQDELQDTPKSWA